MLEKLSYINQTFSRLNKLEKAIILTLTIVLPVAYQIGYRQYEAVAWENKRDECDQFKYLSQQAQDDEKFELSSYLFERGMQCSEELYQMNYRGRVFD